MTGGNHAEMFAFRVLLAELTSELYHVVMTGFSDDNINQLKALLPRYCITLQHCFPLIYNAKVKVHHLYHLLEAKMALSVPRLFCAQTSESKNAEVGQAKLFRHSHK